MLGRNRLLCLLCSLLLCLSFVPSAAAEEAEEETLPVEFFSDAAFFGDSVTKNLFSYCSRTDALGDALFLCEYFYSVENAVKNAIRIWYKGEGRTIETAISLSGTHKAFFMLGINDLPLSGGVDRLMDNWAKLVAMLREEEPELAIYIQSLLPVYYNSQSDANEVIDDYNERLRTFCEENDCVYVDLAPHFKDEHNALKAAYCSDNDVHLTDAGAALWAELLLDPANYSVDPREDYHE